MHEHLKSSIDLIKDTIKEQLLHIKNTFPKEEYSVLKVSQTGI